MLNKVGGRKHCIKGFGEEKAYLISYKNLSLSSFPNAEVVHFAYFMQRIDNDDKS